MSKVTITEDHKWMLVEMTKSNMFDYNITIDDDNFIHYQHKSLDKSGKIYWLEHVIYHLSKKILNKEDVAINMFRTSCLNHIMDVNSLVHPINYLYERYKRHIEMKKQQLELKLN